MLGFEPTTCSDPKHCVHGSYALPTELIGRLEWFVNMARLMYMVIRNNSANSSIEPLMYADGQYVKIICYIPSSEILEFPSVINFDIITCDDINFHVHFLP